MDCARCFNLPQIVILLLAGDTAHPSGLYQSGSSSSPLCRPPSLLTYSPFAVIKWIRCAKTAPTCLAVVGWALPTGILQPMGWTSNATIARYRESRSFNSEAWITQRETHLSAFQSVAFQTAPRSRQLISCIDGERTARTECITVARGICITSRSGTFPEVPERDGVPVSAESTAWTNFCTYFVTISGALGDTDFVNITLHRFEALVPFPSVIECHRRGTANH